MWLSQATCVSPALKQWFGEVCGRPRICLRMSDVQSDLSELAVKSLIMCPTASRMVATIQMSPVQGWREKPIRHG